MKMSEGDSYGDGYGYCYDNSLLPEYGVSALSVPWAIANVDLERRYV